MKDSTRSRDDSLCSILRAISEITALVVRGADRKGFLEETCRILVDRCRCKAAWIGLYENGDIKPVAYHGQSGEFLSSENIEVVDGDRACSHPVARAVICGGPVEHNRHCRSGGDEDAPPQDPNCFGGVALPLFVRGKVSGVVCLCSREDRPFSKEDIEQLGELAEIVSGTLQHLSEADERAAAEKALRQSVENFRALAENANDGIIIIDGAGLTLYANRRAATVTGRTVAELEDRDIEELIRPVEGGGLKQRLLAAPGGAGPFEISFTRKDGSRAVAEVSTAPTTWRENDATMVIIRDITERKETEREKELIHAQLVQAQKMEGIWRLASAITHDFNNLLTTIIGYTELAMAQIGEDGPAASDLAMVMEASNRAAELTRQLLLFSRKHSTSHSSLDPGTTIETMEKMLRRLMGANIEFSVEVPPELWQINGDERKIEQVLMNLAVNAKDAMPEGGTLRLRAENLYLDRNRCRFFPEARPGRYVCITVEDTGIGMDRETVEHIFEPFFTTKSDEKGTGLGLSVVYGIMKEHGGWVDVASRPGGGTIFRLYFPARAERRSAGTREGGRRSELAGLRGNGECVLLVEDEESVRNYTAKALRENGYRVLAVSKASEAADAFDRDDELFDLVLSDVVLPDMTGLELVEELSSKRPGIGILLTSGYSATSEPSLIAMEKKGYSFLAKPFTLPKLLKAVKDSLDPRVK
ncbi:MAG TPA: PAS domain S-box protein [Deltaproteobacteria bacterium]|nr:PAS domain S-box protein [Deltaproteobacteria bacterium]